MGTAPNDLKGSGDQPIENTKKWQNVYWGNSDHLRKFVEFKMYKIQALFQGINENQTFGASYFIRLDFSDGNSILF